MKDTKMKGKQPERLYCSCMTIYTQNRFTAFLMKKLFTLFTIIVLTVMISNNALCAFGNIYTQSRFTDGIFTDVSENDWFYNYVKNAYNYGFVDGKGDGIFDPNGTLSYGEAIKLTCVLNSLYYTDSAEFSEADNDIYISYAKEKGILTGIPEPSIYGIDVPITRAEFAQMLINTLPPDAYTEVNDIPDDSLYGLIPGGEYTDAMYILCRAGIMVGNDQYGTFFPKSLIKRAEVCAVLARIAEPMSRIRFTLPDALPASLIYARGAGAVFHLETYYSTGEIIRNGSGFIISPDGLAVTNYHVIDGAASASVTLNDGQVLPVLGLVAYDAEFNLAIMQLDTNGIFLDHLRIRDDQPVEIGETVYALGNPQGLVNTISEGIISFPEREIEGSLFFQFNAPISFGSGGGAVLDSLGRVVGVSSSSFSSGDRLNLAVPIILLNNLQLGEYITLDSLIQSF